MAANTEPFSPREWHAEGTNLNDLLIFHRERLRRSTFWQNASHHRNVVYLTQDDATILSKTKRNTVIFKVITVVCVCLSLCMPVVASYLSSLISYGCGIPLVLILSAIGSKVRGMSDAIECDHRLKLRSQKMLASDVTDVLSPYGESDLPAIDKRCKSDILMRKELKVAHPQAAVRTKRLVDHLNLDIHPRLKIHAAKEQEGIEPSFLDWREEIREAKQYLRKGKIGLYKQRMNEIRYAALFDSGEELSPLDLPPLIESNTPYNRFLYLHERLCALYHKGQNFFESKLDQEWSRYQLAFQAVDSQQKGWRDHLDYAMDLLRHTEKAINKEIANHPTSRIANYKKEFSTWDQTILSTEQLQELDRWMGDNPDVREVSIREAVKYLCRERTAFIQELMDASRKERINNFSDDSYDREIFAEQNMIDIREAIAQSDDPLFSLGEILSRWIENHENYSKRSLCEIYSRHLVMREAIEQARIMFAPFELCISDKDALDSFNQEMMLPLRKLIVRQGASTWEHFWHIFKSRSPALPFEQITIHDEDVPLLKARKIEEMQLNVNIQKIDRKMLKINRCRRYILESGLQILISIVLVVVQAIFVSNFWIGSGMILASFSLQGLSFLVDQKLHKLHKKKQGLQLHMRLRNDPLIKRVPGTSPELEFVKEVQNRWDLDGKTRTESRIHIEGNDGIKPYVRALEPNIHNLGVRLWCKLVDLQESKRALDKIPFIQEKIEEFRFKLQLSIELNTVLEHAANIDPRVGNALEQNLTDCREEIAMIIMQILKEGDLVSRDLIDRYKELGEQLALFSQDALKKEIEIELEFREQTILRMAKYQRQLDLLRKKVGTADGEQLNDEIDQINQALQTLFERNREKIDSEATAVEMEGLKREIRFEASVFERLVQKQ